MVSSGRSDRSSVVPDGTATLDKTIVEHDFWDLLASEAPLLPEKVQLVALLTSDASGAGVIKGASCSWTGAGATGDATTTTTEEASRVAAPRRKGEFHIVRPILRCWLVE